MATSTPDIQSILESLRASGARSTSSAPYQQRGLPAPVNSYTPSQGVFHGSPAQYGQSPAYASAAFLYPAPSASGSIDLSSVRPVDSGTVNVNIHQAIEESKRYAAEQGLTPYDHSAYPHSDTRGSGRGRSRSPPGRREPYRDISNPYRDERRAGYVYGRDRSISPPRSRLNLSPRARDRSPMRGKDDSGSEIMQVDASLVGLIIGRMGENLRRIEAETNCRVQFIPASNQNDPCRQCKIMGPPTRRAEARSQINRIIEDSGMGSSRGGGGSGGGYRGPNSNFGGANTQAEQEPEATMKIMVPDRTVGLIIGRGGETIRDLQEKSKCHINIVGENKSVNGLRPVNLIGSPEATRMAKELIMEIVDSDSRNMGGNQQSNDRPARNESTRNNTRDNMRDGGGQDKMHDAIYVPSEAVGMIIGKGGETIRQMQTSTGCKINVSQSSGPGEVDREIELVGSRDAITRAKQEIEDKVETVRQKNSDGGGGGGRARRYRDHDNPDYGQSSNSASAPTGMPAAPDAAGGSAADPYAMYGGYQAYMALWYQAMAAQQGQQGANPPPGTS